MPEPISEPAAQQHTSSAAATEHKSPPSISTTADNINPELMEWSSPAFLKRARLSYGSLFGPGYDPFAEEDGSVKGNGRKRTKFGRESGAWKYNSRSPSPGVTSPSAKSVDVSADAAEDHKPEMADEGCQTMNLENDVAGTLADMFRQATSAGREVRMVQPDLKASDNEIRQDVSHGTTGQETPPATADIIVRTNLSSPLGSIPSTAVVPGSPRLHPISPKDLPQISPLISTGLAALEQLQSNHDRQMHSESGENVHAQETGIVSPLGPKIQPSEPDGDHDIDDVHDQTGLSQNEQEFSTSSQKVFAPGLDHGYNTNNRTQPQWGPDVTEALYPHVPLHHPPQDPDLHIHTYDDDTDPEHDGRAAVRPPSEIFDSQNINVTDESMDSEDERSKDNYMDHYVRTAQSKADESGDGNDDGLNERHTAQSYDDVSEDGYYDEDDDSEEVGHRYQSDYITGYGRRDYPGSEDDNEEDEEMLAIKEYSEDDNDVSSEEMGSLEGDQTFQRGPPEVIDLLSDSEEDEIARPAKLSAAGVAATPKSESQAESEAELKQNDNEDSNGDSHESTDSVGQYQIKPESQPGTPPDFNGGLRSTPEVDSGVDRTMTTTEVGSEEITASTTHHHESISSVIEQPGLITAAVEYTETVEQHDKGNPSPRAEHGDIQIEPGTTQPPRENDVDQNSEKISDDIPRSDEPTLAARLVVSERTEISYPSLRESTTIQSADLDIMTTRDNGISIREDEHSGLAQLPTPDATQVNEEKNSSTKQLVAENITGPVSLPADDESTKATEVQRPKESPPVQQSEYGSSLSINDRPPCEMSKRSPQYRENLRQSPQPTHRTLRAKKGAERARTDRSSPLVVDEPASSLGYDGSADLATGPPDSPSKDSRGRQGSDADLRLRLTKSLRSNLGDFTLLKVIRFHMEKRLDVLAIVTTTPPEAERAKTGPRSYLLRFNVTDASIAPAAVTEVQIFRAWKDALPVVKPGDGILLRHFNVKSERGRGFVLRSNDESSWAVFKGDDKPQVKGPPVEYGEEEGQYVSDLRTWYGGLDSASTAKLDKANAVKEKSITKGKS